MSVSFTKKSAAETSTRTKSGTYTLGQDGTLDIVDSQTGVGPTGYITSTGTVVFSTLADQDAEEIYIGVRLSSLADTTHGGGGNDTISGGADDDTLSGGGGDGDDHLDGGTGIDRMEGGHGADSYYVEAKKDVVYEADNLPADTSGLVQEADIGDYIDTVYSCVKHTLTNYVENLVLTGGGSKIAGTGNTLDNEITGNAGANKLTGQSGDDTLDGGAGTDKLTGNAGADTFKFSNLPAGKADTISDFDEEDVLAFDTQVFIALAGAGSGNFVAGTAAQDGDDYLIYDSAKRTVYYDADGASGGAALKVVALKGATPRD